MRTFSYPLFPHLNTPSSSPPPQKDVPRYKNTTVCWIDQRTINQLTNRGVSSSFFFLLQKLRMRNVLVLLLRKHINSLSPLPPLAKSTHVTRDDGPSGPSTPPPFGQILFTRVFPGMFLVSEESEEEILSPQEGGVCLAANK